MVDNAARGICATQSRTGVHTSQPLASFVRGTICIDVAFGPAGHIGIAKIVGDTVAGTSTTAVRTERIGATRRGVTGV